MAERAKVRVEFDDGSSTEFNPNKPKLLLAMEREFGIQVPEKHEHICWLAWHALGRPDGDLDTWLDRVEYVEEVSEGDAPGEDQS